jgi:hypothetical protein
MHFFRDISIALARFWEFDCSILFFIYDKTLPLGQTCLFPSLKKIFLEIPTPTFHREYIIYFFCRAFRMKLYNPHVNNIRTSQINVLDLILFILFQFHVSGILRRDNLQRKCCTKHNRTSFPSLSSSICQRKLGTPGGRLRRNHVTTLD